MQTQVLQKSEYIKYFLLFAHHAFAFLFFQFLWQIAFLCLQVLEEILSLGPQRCLLRVFPSLQSVCLAHKEAETQSAYSVEFKDMHQKKRSSFSLEWLNWRCMQSAAGSHLKTDTVNKAIRTLPQAQDLSQDPYYWLSFFLSFQLGS